MSRDTVPTIALRPRALPSPAPPPPLRSGLVPRAHLLRRLVASRDQPVALLVAPAGYGKTTLVTEWALRDERPFTWIALADTETPDAALAAVAEVRGASRPRVVVVDDAQRADAATLTELLERARRFPIGTTLALLSRTVPGEPTGRLRAHRLIFELTAR